jgi:hypothetical protein
MGLGIILFCVFMFAYLAIPLTLHQKLNLKTIIVGTVFSAAIAFCIFNERTLSGMIITYIVLMFSSNNEMTNIVATQAVNYALEKDAKEQTEKRNI